MDNNDYSERTYRIAKRIAERVETQSAQQKAATGKAWGLKRRGDAALDMWIGAAICEQETTGKEDAFSGMCLLSAIRGYQETVDLIDRYEKAQKAAKVISA